MISSNISSDFCILLIVHSHIIIVLICIEQVTYLIKKGSDYWRRLALAGLQQKLLSDTSDQIYLQQAITMASSGKIPCSASGRVPSKTMTMVKAVKSIEDRLLAEGVSVDDEAVRITLTNYKMH